MSKFPDQTLKTRTARPDDAAAIAAVHVAAWKETYPGLVPDQMLQSIDVAARQDYWQRQLDGRDAQTCLGVFVAEAAETVLGFAAATHQRSGALASKGFTGEVAAIYLLKKAQRQGLGRRLFGLACACLHQAGHNSVALWVLDGNARAEAFYCNLGGDIVGQKIERRGETVLTETAYGWSDLTPLVQTS